jgi:uncharacterized protein (DUF302 family)
MSNTYGFGCRVALPFADAIAAVTAALKQEGFGVLTEIDVKATLKAKIGVDYRPYVILGACNPNLAYRGLQAEPELGLLLPCNVIVYDNGDGASTVSIVDPLQMLGFVENPALQPVADEANSRLRRVIDRLAEQSPAEAPV